MKKSLTNAEIREFEEEFAQMNISVKMANGKYKTFETVLSEVVDIWSRLNDVQQGYLVEMILNEEEQK